MKYYYYRIGTDWNRGFQLHPDAEESFSANLDIAESEKPWADGCISVDHDSEGGTCSITFDKDRFNREVRNVVYIDESSSEGALIKFNSDRAAAYPSVPDQLDMIYHDGINGTSVWKDAIAKVKSDIPKP